MLCLVWKSYYLSLYLSCSKFAWHSMKNDALKFKNNNILYDLEDIALVQEKRKSL